MPVDKFKLRKKTTQKVLFC